METTQNTLLDGRLQILQPTQGFRVAVDSVCLAASVPVWASSDAGQTIVELGCGTGAAALCLLSRCPNVNVVGLERNPQHVELAERSAALNNLSTRLSVVEADVQQIDDFPKEAMHADGVMINPPYFQSGNMSQDHGRAAANHEDHVALKDWVAAASRCLKPKGHLTMIHAADRLTDILVALDKGFGAIEVIPLWPKQGRDAKRVIIRAVKGRKTLLRMRAGIVLHQRDGSYTDVANDLLRDSKALDDVL